MRQDIFTQSSLREPGVIVAATILFCLVIWALMPQILVPGDGDTRYRPYLEPSSVHPLGTDDIGHDILYLVIISSRISLIITFAAGGLSTLIGVTIGVISGYFSGIGDDILMGFTDIILIIPKIPVIILLAAMTRPNLLLLILVLGLLSWETTARVVRSRVMQVAGAGYILSARCLGFSPGWIMARDILPVIYPVVLPKLMLVIAGALISEASLSFLGLSDSTMNSWGKMIADAFTHGGFIRGMWWWYTPPALCIVLMILSCVRIGMIWEQKGTETAFE
ncbi:MAG TPA: ABC transporter permease [Methanospirillum sp.]|nr:ABC transporter permease [Methanospirillum sp.]